LRSGKERRRNRGQEEEKGMTEEIKGMWRRKKIKRPERRHTFSSSSPLS